VTGGGHYKDRETYDTAGEPHDLLHEAQPLWLASPLWLTTDLRAKLGTDAANCNTGLGACAIAARAGTSRVALPTRGAPAMLSGYLPRNFQHAARPAC
jgi:hypothetical protein